MPILKPFAWIDSCSIAKYYTSLISGPMHYIVIVN
nr:MAG TPA: hypothetical protein [Caudoviricetes sp.]